MGVLKVEVTRINKEKDMMMSYIEDLTNSGKYTAQGPAIASLAASTTPSPSLPLRHHMNDSYNNNR